MQFDPAIHTKTYLLAHPEEAVSVSEFSAYFASSDLAQDVDILNLMDQYGDTVAHSLASRQSSWAQSGAAQDLAVLCIKNTKGYTVAHMLVENQPEWIKTEAAQKFEVLSLAVHDGYLVAHGLAWSNSDWHQTDAAQKKQILNLSSSEDGSVAQILAQKSNSKGDTMVNFVNSGYAYRTVATSMGFNKPIFSNKDICDFCEKTSQLILDEFDDVLRMKKWIVFYSTLKNLEFDIENDNSNNNFKHILKDNQVIAEEQMRNLFKTNTHLFKDVSHLNDVNCEPAMDLMSQLISEYNLKQALIPEHQALADEPPAQLLLY
jgi:hypothetical protein